MSDKSLCDHCGKLSSRYAGVGEIIWCGRCIDDNIKALMGLDLEGSFYPSRGMGDFGFTIKENIRKLRTIPKPGTTPVAVAPPVAVKEPEVQLEPKFDFDKYNSTLPGKHYGR